MVVAMGMSLGQGLTPIQELWFSRGVLLSHLCLLSRVSAQTFISSVIYTHDQTHCSHLLWNAQYKIAPRPTKAQPTVGGHWLWHGHEEACRLNLEGAVDQNHTHSFATKEKH